MRWTTDQEMNAIITLKMGVLNGVECMNMHAHTEERVIMTNFGHLGCTQYCCKPSSSYKEWKKCTCTQT